eukprot:3942609-Amphidinium_carterae.1
MESRTRFGAAANAAPKTTTLLPLGSWVYFWFAPGNAHVVSEETQCVTLRCPREHVHLAASDEAEGASLLEGALSELKDEGSQRGPHRFVDLSRQRDPPQEEKKELQMKNVFKTDEEGQTRERESKREKTEHSASSGDNTMLHSWHVSSDHVRVFANAKTPGQGEVAYWHLDPARQRLLDEARKTEFESLLAIGAIGVCDPEPEESRRIRRTMNDRIIPSRCDGLIGINQGFKDPDILDVTTAAPTPSSNAVTCALLATVLERDKGPLFAAQPWDGSMPGLEQDQVVQLLKD